MDAGELVLFGRVKIVMVVGPCRPCLLAINPQGA